MKKITQIQYQYLQKICFLLFIQLILLLFVVWFTHHFFPKVICLATCHRWFDLLIFFLIMIVLIYISHRSDLPMTIRYIAFFSMSVVLAYLIALQYNIVTLLNRGDQKTALIFMKAVIIVVSILLINLILLPFTLRYMGTMYAMSTLLFICLIGLIVWSLFIGNHFLLVPVSLLVFLGLLVTDLTIVVSECQDQKCDALHGASLLYVDLVNILQNLFLLIDQYSH